MSISVVAFAPCAIKNQQNADLIVAAIALTGDQKSGLNWLAVKPKYTHLEQTNGKVKTSAKNTIQNKLKNTLYLNKKSE